MHFYLCIWKKSEIKILFLQFFFDRFTIIFKKLSSDIIEKLFYICTVLSMNV